MALYLSCGPILHRFSKVVIACQHEMHVKTRGIRARIDTGKLPGKNERMIARKINRNVDTQALNARRARNLKSALAKTLIVFAQRGCFCGHA